MDIHARVVKTVSTPIGEMVIRYPGPGDAPALLEFINAMSREKTFILFQGEQLTLAQEEAWLQDRLAEVQAKTGVLLSVRDGDRVVGTSGISLKPLAERHVGVLGISIVEGYRGFRLGSHVFEAVIAEAEATLEGLRIIELGVFGNNPVAHAMYLRHGFVEHGRLPGGVMHCGVAVDHILMHRVVTRE